LYKYFFTPFVQPVSSNAPICITFGLNLKYDSSDLISSNEPEHCSDNGVIPDPVATISDDLDWYYALVERVAIHTTFDPLDVSALRIMRNEVIKAARVMDVYDRLTTAIIHNAIRDALTLRSNSAEIIKSQFLSPDSQHESLRLHDQSLGFFTNEPKSIMASFLGELRMFFGQATSFRMPARP
jgi:hypothetical protein